MFISTGWDAFTGIPVCPACGSVPLVGATHDQKVNGNHTASFNFLFRPRLRLGGHNVWAFPRASREPKPSTMKNTTKRSILRSIHILFALPLLGYIYGPPSETVKYLPYFRFIYFPVVVLSGLWMWKSHVVRRHFSGTEPK